MTSCMDCLTLQRGCPCTQLNWSMHMVRTMSTSNCSAYRLSLHRKPRFTSKCGNHYSVYHEGDERGFVTQDYGIANIFGAEKGQSAGVSMMGVLKEIIVVRYLAQRRVVFRGSWIRNDLGPQSSTKVDQYGFTIVHFNDRIARDIEPYVLPATIQQVPPCNELQWGSGGNVSLTR